MLLISGFKDELYESSGELGIEWKVADFVSLSEEAGCYYQSPAFAFAKSTWNLQLFPGGDNIQNDSTRNISVYFRGSNFMELSNTVTFMLGTKKADGTIEKTVLKFFCKMLLISGFKDELYESSSELGIEWKVADFFSLSEEAGCYYQSPAFTFAKSTWNLQLFPGGDNIQSDPTSYISVYLRGSNFMEPPNTVNFTLGMKKADGTIEKIVDSKHSFDEKSSVAGQQKFYQRSEILRRKAELAPKGDFILTCTVKHNTMKTLEVATQQMKLVDLERLYTDLKDLFSCKRNCDALVKVKDKEFRVHRSVLIARSTVFESMFEHDMKEKKTGVITIDDCDPDSFGDFLQYLYTGKAENVSPPSALHLYCTAHKYDVKELQSFCVAYLMRNLSVENVLDVVSLAEQYDEKELISAAQVFFNKNVGRILSTMKWESLLQENYRLANMLLKEMATRIKIQA